MVCPGTNTGAFACKPASKGGWFGSEFPVPVSCPPNCRPLTVRLLFGPRPRPRLDEFPLALDAVSAGEGSEVLVEAFGATDAGLKLSEALLLPRPLPLLGRLRGVCLEDSGLFAGGGCAVGAGASMTECFSWSSPAQVAIVASCYVKNFGRQWPAAICCEARRSLRHCLASSFVAMLKKIESSDKWLLFARLMEDLRSKVSKSAEAEWSRVSQK